LTFCMTVEFGKTGTQNPKIITNQLSRELIPVPEPGILILLGIAMSAVGIAYPFVRKI
jgi:hypothetical protein